MGEGMDEHLMQCWKLSGLSRSRHSIFLIPALKKSLTNSPNWQLLFAVCLAVLSPLSTNAASFTKRKVGLIDLEEIPRSLSFCEYTIQQDGVFVVEDAWLDERFSENPLVIGNQRCASMPALL